MQFTASTTCACRQFIVLTSSPSLYYQVATYKQACRQRGLALTKYVVSSFRVGLEFEYLRALQHASRRQGDQPTRRRSSPASLPFALRRVTQMTTFAEAIAIPNNHCAQHRKCFTCPFLARALLRAVAKTCRTSKRFEGRKTV